MAVDRSTIDGQLRQIGEGDRWWEQREFRDLPYILNADERIHGIVNGKLFGPRRPRVMPAAHWLFVATDQRLICLKRERVGRGQVDIRLDQILHLQHGSRLRGVQIVLDTPQRRYRIRVSKGDAFRFIGALTPLLMRGLPAPAEGATPAPLLLPAPAAQAGSGLTGFFSRMTGSVPAADYVMRGELERVVATVERLERELERTQQHVEFLENLLQSRAEGAFSLPGRSADS